MKLLLFALALGCLALGLGFAHDDAKPEDLLFYPPVLEVTRDSTGFIQQMIEFGSASGDSVRITHIEGSCRCATATVQRSLAHDSVNGKFYLGINAKHFVDSLNYVDYTVQHTGANSPQMFRVIVHIPPKH